MSQKGGPQGGQENLEKGGRGRVDIEGREWAGGGAQTLSWRKDGRLL